MALNPVRADLYPPMFAKQFATLTAAVLHSTGAPAGIAHLPCGIIAETSVAFTFKDAAGTTITITPAAGVFLPISPSEITSASVAVVTVFWNAEP